MDILGSKTNSPKNVLVITYGPVPTPEFQKIEGGGMRCWGLATGLRDNGHNVTVSIFQEFKQSLSQHDGVKLHNWTLGDDFKAYINTFDAVIISYSMGDPSVFVADNLSHHITLVLDCYVPIFIEISARDSDDKPGELRGYLHEVKRLNHVLQRGDFFLCANEPQRHMYAGILGSLGILNPYSYRQKRILLVPFGVDSGEVGKAAKITANPYAVKRDDFVLLWFGGLYPWFNFEPLINAVKQLSKDPHFKFYLVGGKNPYNNHPDFIKQYERVYNAFQEFGLIDKSVFFVEWIDFDDRARWYKNADLVISINSAGDENIYSWRTRVMDYLWGELPMISNGGDPLSDELISKGAAVQTGLVSDEVVTIVQKFIKHPSEISAIKKNLLDIKKQYHWEKVTQVLSDQLTSEHNLPYLDGLTFMEEHKISDRSQPTYSKKFVRVAAKAKSYAVRAKQKGLKRSARFAVSMAKTQAKALLNKGSTHNTPKAVFISHPIDHTGAPLVLLDIISDFGKVLPSSSIHLVAPAIHKSLLNPLLTAGYKIHKMADGIGGRLIQATIKINPDDFVLVNTMAMYQNYKDYMYWMLESGRLKQAHWFIHEDNPSKRFGNTREVTRIKRLVDAEKLVLLVPSVQTAREYNEFFETTFVRSVSLRVEVPQKYQKPRAESDFDTIKFFISGNPLDGRKGQLLFLAALQLFEAKYKAKDPAQYRSYSLDLVAIGDDYISEQITAIGKAILGDSLHIHPIVDKETALAIDSGCNVTVCSSLNETFALYVAEGMLMGHPIIRNKTSGWQEQIKDDENGYLFETLSVEDLAKAISKILSKKLTNKQLLEMSKASQKLANTFSNANYYQQIAQKSDSFSG